MNIVKSVNYTKQYEFMKALIIVGVRVLVLENHNVVISLVGIENFHHFSF